MNAKHLVLALCLVLIAGSLSDFTAAESSIASVRVLCSDDTDCLGGGVCAGICYYPHISTAFPIYSPNVSMNITISGFPANSNGTLVISGSNASVNFSVALDAQGTATVLTSAPLALGPYNLTFSESNTSNLSARTNISVQAPYAFTGIIFDPYMQPVPSDVQVFQNDTLILNATETYNFTLNYGETYEIEVDPHPFELISRITLITVINEGDSVNILGVDKQLDTSGFDEIFGYFPAVDQYLEVHLEINNSNGYDRAYKCRSYDFFARTCTGGWDFLSMINDSTVLVLQNGDPAIGFIQGVYTPPEAPTPPGSPGGGNGGAGSAGNWTPPNNATGSGIVNATAPREPVPPQSVHPLARVAFTINLSKLSGATQAQPLQITYNWLWLTLGIIVILLLLASYLYERRIVRLKVLREVGYEHIDIKNVTFVWRRNVHAVFLLLSKATLTGCDLDKKPLLKYHVVSHDDSIHDLIALLLADQRMVLKWKDRYVVCIHKHLEPQHKTLFTYFGEARSAKAFALLKHLGDPIHGTERALAVPFSENPHDTIGARARHAYQSLIASADPPASLVTASRILEEFLREEAA